MNTCNSTYNILADSQEPTSTTDEKSGDDGLSTGVVVGIVVGVLVGVLLLTVLVIGIYVWLVATP